MLAWVPNITWLKSERAAVTSLCCVLAVHLQDVRVDLAVETALSAAPVRIMVMASSGSVLMDITEELHPLCHFGAAVQRPSAGSSGKCCSGFESVRRTALRCPCPWPAPLDGAPVLRHLLPPGAAPRGLRGAAVLLTSAHGGSFGAGGG